MKEINTPEGKFNVPEKWQDLMLSTYLKVAGVQDDPEEEFRSLIIIEAYTGIPLQTLKRMKLTELHEISKLLLFTNTPIPEVPVEYFSISGQTYHVMQTFLLEQAQDYFAVEAILTECKNDSLTALPKLLAVICKLPGENLDEIDIEKRQKLFADNLNVCDANSLRLFFSQCAMLFQLNSLLYSKREEVIQQKIEEVENSLKQLDGTTLYGKWLGKTLRRFLRYYEQSWKTYSSGNQSESKDKTTRMTLKRLLRRKMVRKSTGDKIKYRGKV